MGVRRAKRAGPPEADAAEAALARLARVAAALRSDIPVSGEPGATVEQFRIAVDAMPLGLCYFDASETLLVCNRRYSEIYRLAEGQVKPGMTLRQIVDLRTAAGTCAMLTEDYLIWCAAVAKGTAPMTWTAQLCDGRTVLVRHHSLPGGGWVALHEDVSAADATRVNANERMSLRVLIDFVPDYLWVKDVDSRFVVANRALAVDAGRERGTDMVGLTDFDIHSPDIARQFRADEIAVLQSGMPLFDREERVIGAEGREKWVLSTKVPVRDGEDRVIGLVGIARDITARKLSERWRDGQAEVLEMIAMGRPLSVVLDHFLHLVEAQIEGITASVLLVDGDRLRHGASPNLPQSYTALIDGVRIGPKVGSCGTAVYRREPVFVADVLSDPLWADYVEVIRPHGFRSCWSVPIISHRGHVLGTFAMYSRTVREPTAAELRLFDVTARIAGIAIERKQAEDRIQFMASHDSLTGLPNRSLLDDLLSRAIREAEHSDRWVSVLFADLDNFKFVNDSLGHGAGDDLLKIVAQRMVTALAAADTVVRLGGDEFVIVLADQPRNAEAIAATVLKIKEAITAPLQLDGRDVAVTASIGVANFPNDGTDAKTLLANADAAMYRAKETGRDGIQFFTADLNERTRERLVLQEELRFAVTHQHLRLVYQPQIDLRTGRVLAVEALLRWNHPQLGPVGPDRFIPVAEETGLIVPLGDWVLHEACRRNKAWQVAGLPPIRVSVNVSARQFRDRMLVGHVMGALQASGLEPRYLELELTESLIMHDVDAAVATMRRLQELGVQLAIDDFGTGYSSLSALKTFPVSRLKIDKSFIGDLTENEDDRAVATALISLGQKLKLRVIAEGVENQQQMDFLREQNCDEIQGYHVSRPLEADDLTAYLETAARAAGS